jgi:putative inorganic carbon (HCO3(-)) transporter
MAYLLFLLVNVALFVRPGEVVPAWQGLEIYYYVIVACLVFAAPAIVEYLLKYPLETQLITLCVFGLLIAVLLPPLLAWDLDELQRTGVAFLKVVAYYLIAVSVITTPARLRGLIATLVVCCTALAVVTLLRYYQVLEVPRIKAAAVETMIGPSGETIIIQRMQGTGIFQDPNDLCVMLAAALPWALYLIAADRSWLLRIVWVAIVLVYAYTIYLTKSRGGLIGVLAGLGTYVWWRHGWQRAVVLGFLCLPAVAVVFAGRHAAMDAKEGTAQTRIQLWSDWLYEARANMPLGMGMQLPKEIAGEEDKSALPGEIQGHLAHNAYLQAFSDMGLMGGCLFLGMYGLTLLSIHRVGTGGSIIVDPGQRQLQPFLLASATGYAIGLLALSLTYTVPTYLIPALAVAFMRTTVCHPPQQPLRFDERMLFWMAAAGFCFLVWVYVVVRLFVNR